MIKKILWIETSKQQLVKPNEKTLVMVNENVDFKVFTLINSGSWTAFLKT